MILRLFDFLTLQSGSSASIKWAIYRVLGSAHAELDFAAVLQAVPPRRVRETPPDVHDDEGCFDGHCRSLDNHQDGQTTVRRSAIPAAESRGRGFEHKVTWLHDSLLDLHQMGLDPFDYINYSACCIISPICRRGWQRSNRSSKTMARSELCSTDNTAGLVFIRCRS